MVGEAVAAERPFATVVIATRDRAARLEQCLASLADSQPSEPFEIVVVDNGSTDATPAVVRQASQRWRNVRLASEPKPGSARALQTGALGARGRVLIFVDDDMVAVPRFVDYHIRAHREHWGDCVLGDVRSAPGPKPFDRMLAYVFDGPRGTLGEREAGPLDYWSGNASMSRDLYLGLGGYRDEFGDLGYGKDIDFGHRLVAAGVRLRFVKEALTYHQVSERFAERLRKAQRMGTACAYLAEAYPELPIEPGLLRRGHWYSAAVVWACRALAAALEPFDRGTTIPPHPLLTLTYSLGLQAATAVGIHSYQASRAKLASPDSPRRKGQTAHSGFGR
jgi:glycosyltransferase involved in cell wall biosynthesis